jgi:hypothetical protein
MGMDFGGRNLVGGCEERLELAVDERSMGTAAEGEIDIFRSSVFL